MKKLLFLSLVLGSMLTVMSCSKDNYEIWMEYRETACAPSWTHGDNAELESALRAHLDSKEIEYFQIIVEGRLQGHCLACSCYTGRIIKVRTTNDDREDMEEEGFKKI